MFWEAGGYNVCSMWWQRERQNKLWADECEINMLTIRRFHMFLKRVYIKNFRSLKNIRVDLDENTVLMRSEGVV